LNRDSETAKLILEIMVTIIISAIIWYLAKIAITAASAGLPIDIGALIDALIMLVGGYIVVSLLSRAVYRVVLRTSGEIAASSVRSAIRILGIGVLLAGAAGDPYKPTGRSSYRGLHRRCRRFSNTAGSKPSCSRSRDPCYKALQDW